MARMLVVDDDPAWRALYRMALEDRFEIFEATDGQHGLAVLDSVNPDVILLDLRMAGMDGLDFIRRADHRGDHAPIVVCSGALIEGERLAIPGVLITRKTPDLRDLWNALRATIPDMADLAPATKPATVPAEETLWRD